ncbi:DUF5661 family protein [Arsenicicoccus dermatophilus]|uniref:DUF5661 family protein n=1 Tax=Arsenicicoccus dermatophilus TaxID=1076331 RepID=UPI001F4C7852|nr:DUF5661 family protein [Arsenicicoccus dermatophilus]MCH8611552.1 hypothetical protein [Arsenicicoccus dermatophilus]
MKFQTFDEAVAKKAKGDDLVAYVIDRINDFTDGKDVDLDFLTRKAVGTFCTELGISRNWATLELDEIAPDGEEGVAVVPEDETVAILSALKYLVAEKVIEPSADGEDAPDLLNDFLPEGEEFQGERCLGHLWEFRYALAVELEHGVTRGTNVTQNHPLLTGLVVLAHLAEDRLYYARLWVMEVEGELFDAQLKGDSEAVLESLGDLALAQKHLQARLSEKVDEARAKAEQDTGDTKS